MKNLDNLGRVEIGNDPVTAARMHRLSRRNKRDNSCWVEGQNENWRLKVQRLYTGEIGVREATGKNDGQRVEEYLHYTGLRKGNAWCAAFVCWVLGKAGIDNPRSGWTPALFPAKKVVWQRGRRIDVTADSLCLPSTGDVFGLYFPEMRRIAHVGFVDDWQSKWVITVEGNTNSEGGRDGEGVFRRRRLVTSVYQVASYY